MKPRHLEIFYAIMVSSSLTEAARRLAVSQPAVSASLRQMEDELGLSLFERFGGRLVPTAEAELLLPEVERIFLRLQTVSQLVKDIRGGASSFLSIVGAPTLADVLIPRALARMRERRPGIRIRLETGVARHAADKVIRREADLGLIYGANTNPEADGEIVGRTTVACAMRADHPCAALAVVTPRDLRDQAIFTYPKGAPIRDLVDHAFADAGFELTTAAEVGYALMACYLALSGGIALIDPLIGSTLGFPDLVIRPFQPSLRIPIHFLHSKGRQRSRLGSEMVEELRLAFAEALAVANDMCAPFDARERGLPAVKTLGSQ